jgi:MazG family protein
MSTQSGGNTGSDAFAHLIAIIAELRQRCPWDRQQTLPEAARHLLEEAYEVVDAITAANPAAVAEELGDLIVQALFVATIASESNGPRVPELLEGAARKLVRRHPHVYGNAKASTLEQVMELWDQVKAAEKGKAPKRSSLAKTGRALPALMRAEKLGVRARRRGMDWKDAREVLSKIREELDEVMCALDAGDQGAAADEVGDLMLAVANLPRFLGRDAEQTLRRSCDKFVTRFGEVERQAGRRGLKLAQLSPQELERLWQDAKQSGHNV